MLHKSYWDNGVLSSARKSLKLPGGRVATCSVTQFYKDNPRYHTRMRTCARHWHVTYGADRHDLAAAV
jgi:hypothetical protein